MPLARSRWWAWLRVYGGIALGVGMLVWFGSRIDLPEMLGVLAEVDRGWLFLATVAVLLHYALHGWRWKILLHHVAPDIDHHTIWRATTILWAFNTLLPLRAGNLLRPAVVSMKSHVPYTTLLFTLVAETVCDIFGIVGMGLVTLLYLPDDLLLTGPLVRLRVVGAWVGGFTLVFLLGVVLLSSRGARSVVESALAPLPSASVRERALLLFDQLVEGMAAVGEPRQFFAAMVVTVLVWGSWAASIHFTLWAFALDLPWSASMFIETALSLTTMVPQAPGFLGVFQVVTEEGLGLFGAPLVKAKAIALVLWFLCFVPITILGVWDAWRLGIGIGPGARDEAFHQLAEHTEERVKP